MEINAARIQSPAAIAGGQPLDQALPAASDSVSVGGSPQTIPANKVDPSMIKQLFENHELVSQWECTIPYSYGVGNGIHPTEKGTVCVGIYGSVRCHDASTGNVQWERKVNNYYGKDLDSRYSDGRLYLRTCDVNKSDNDYLVVLDARDGAEQWRHKMDKYEGVRLTEGGDVLLGQKRGFIVLDGKDGSEKQNTVLKEELPDRYVRVNAMRKDGMVIASTPDATYGLSPDGAVMWKDRGSSFDNAFFIDNRAVIGSPGGGLTMKDLSTGKALWKNTEQNMRVIGISDSGLFTSNIYDLDCLDLSDGHVKWSIKGGQDEYSVIKALGPDGTPYVARGYSIEALDPETGTPRWSLAFPTNQLERRTTAVLDEGRLFLSDGEKLHVIDAEKGLKMSQFDACPDSEITTFTLSPGGMLFVETQKPKGSSYGTSSLYCIDLSSGGVKESPSPPVTGGEGVIEEMDDWVVISGVKLPRGRLHKIGIDSFM
jgi:outer membrane protein assembly factor BamB